VTDRNLIAELIVQYSDGIRHLDRYRRSIDRSNLDGQDEARTVSSMLNDMRYALDWMRRGRRPGSRKGAERRDIYRRRELIESMQPMTPEEERRLIDCVAVMTERELTCWLLHMAHGLTFAEIGDRLGLSRRTVQQYVERARKKVLDVQMTCV